MKIYNLDYGYLDTRPCKKPWTGCNKERCQNTAVLWHKSKRIVYVNHQVKYMDEDCFVCEHHLQITYRKEKLARRTISRPVYLGDIPS